MSKATISGLQKTTKVKQQIQKCLFMKSYGTVAKNNESQWCYCLAAPYPHPSTVHAVVGHENQQLHCLRLLM